MIDVATMSDLDIEEMMVLGRLELKRRAAAAKAVKTAKSADKALAKAAKDKAKEAAVAAKQSEYRRQRLFNAKEAIRRGMPLEEAVHQFNVTAEELS